MIRQLLAALFLLAAPAAAQRADEAPVVIGKFGGINQFVDTTQVEDGDAIDAANVLTDSGYVEKRPGNVNIATILSGYAIKYAAQFVAPSATRYIIANSSITHYATSLAGSPVAIGTGTIGFNVDSVTAYGKHIIVNGIDAPVTYDGSSSGSIAGMPICTLVEFANERLYCGNTATSSSQVAVSSFGGVAYWTIPSVLTADSPNSFTFQRDDGEGINCMKQTPWGLVVGKRRSLHILKGYDNLTYYKLVIDPAIGCLDKRSMQMVDGLLVWLAIDGIYAWGGSGAPRLLSRDITPLIKQIRQLNSNAGQWIVSTGAGWQSGTSDSNGPTSSWDTASVTASITPTMNTVRLSTGNWPAGTFVNASTGTTGLRSGVVFENSGFEKNNITTNWTSTAGWTATAGSQCYFFGLYTAGASACSTSFPDYRIRVMTTAGAILYNAISSGAITGSLVCDHGPEVIDVSTQTVDIKLNVLDMLTGDTLQSSTFSAAGLADGKIYYFYHYDSPTVIPPNPQTRCGRIDFPDPWFVNKGTFTSAAADTLFSNPIWGAPAISSTSPAGTAITFRMQVATSASGAWGTAVDLSTTVVPAVASQRYFRIVPFFTTSIATQSATVSTFTMVTTSSMCYYSEVHAIGTAITAWRTIDFTATEVPTGLLTYAVRSASYAFAAAATSPAFTAQTNHITVAVSTGSSFQYRICAPSVTSSSETAIVSRSATNWQEGTSVPLASGFIDHRYFLCAMFSTAAVINDGCIVFMQNGKWTRWTGVSPGAMTLYNTDLIVGSGDTDSNVYKIMQPNVYDDAGSAIAAYWVTKDFVFGSPYENKALTEMWIDAYRVANGSMTVSYAANKSSTWIDKTINLDSQTFYISKRVPIAAGTPLGKFFRFKFADSTVFKYMRLNDFGIWTQRKERLADYQ